MRHAGMRCLSPTARWWPSWADVFPNIMLMPKIEASTFIMHVSRLYCNDHRHANCNDWILVVLLCHIIELQSQRQLL